MFHRGKLKEFDDYFKTAQQRAQNTVYFCRLDMLNQEAKRFLIRYLAEVKQKGIYQRERLVNPDGNQLAFMEETIGTAFLLDGNFLLQTLHKWLPRLRQEQLELLTEAMYQVLSEMERAGKTEDMQRNAYFKFMCWYYYRFERVLALLGNGAKLLYEGGISEYGLKLLRILSACGCDILLIEPENTYLKWDPTSMYSQRMVLQNAEKLPADFSVASLMQPPEKGAPAQEKTSPRVVLPERPAAHHLPHIQPNGTVGTNIWLTGDVFADLLKPADGRSSDPKIYCNVFASLQGTDDSGEFPKELARWKLRMEHTKRPLVLVEHRIPMPDAQEIAKIAWGTCSTEQELLRDALECIHIPKCLELEKLFKKSLLAVLEEGHKPIQTLKNQAALMVCWVNRYLPQLFPASQLDTCPVFLFFGIIGHEHEARFLRLLAGTPVDVLILCPQPEGTALLKDPRLFCKIGAQAWEMTSFPENITDVPFGTAAYQAERDLDTILYQGTGVYRNRQFKRAIPIQIRTTYEEIRILWDQEAKYRPDFEVLDDRVMVPVLFAKVSGVKDSDTRAYWEWVKDRVTEDTYLMKVLPYLSAQDPNPIKQHVPTFLKDGKILPQKIRQHPAYQYGFIREDMQDYMLDKLQLLLDSRLIEGTFSQGVEYTICAVALNLERPILRLIQKYDFTRTIPKLMIINTTEHLSSLEDSILTAYLSMLGFDILLLVPTGYQGVERFYTRPLFVEHQIGDYVYDLRVPELKQPSGAPYRENIIDKLFRRGK